MKIAIFSDTFFPDQINGVAHVAFQSAEILSELGHEVMVFTVSQKKDQSNTVDKKNKFRIYRTPSMPLWSYVGERLSVPIGLTFRQVKKFNPDVIHAHTPFGLGWEAVWAAKLLKKPLVGTHHTFFDHYLKHIKMDYKWFKKPSWKFVVSFYNRCNLVISPSVAMANGIKKHGLKRPIQIISNPVNTDFFRPNINEAITKEKILIYMGRLSYEKSIDFVLQAFAIVVKKYPDYQLMLVGDGPERTKLENLCADLGITNRVIFTGFFFDQNLVTALQSARVFITASKSENMPISVLEAMACGLPVIGVDALGIPEIVQNNINGFIVPPDQPEVFAQKILELISDPALLEKFSAKSRELSMFNSHASVGKALENAYKILINKII